jgi:NAD(P)-dependent dehydrogenase (short-subunit alcohol dehydrogenase family)
MTETSPLATTSDYIGEYRNADEETQLDVVAMQGLPLPFVELRAIDDDGNEIPWDGEAMGELEVRGPWVAAGYYETPEQAERWTDDGWFKTGDIASFHPMGYVMLKDRSKDVIKSGGEWISSVELENALMAHPAIAEAAVIAIPHPKWDERPLAVCVLREGQSATPDELTEFLAPNFAKFWLPDAYEFVDEIPKTAVASSARQLSVSSSRTRRFPRPSGNPGKTFIVTGGRSGLGEATAAMLEREGAKVVIADLPETDVTDEEGVRTLVESCDELHGVVNCAGIGGGARVIGFPLDRFRKVIEVNLIGTFNVLSQAAAKMAEGEPDEEGTRGVIVNTASNAAFDGQIGQAAYTASKAGRRRNDAADRARPRLRRGIRVVTIAPGPPTRRCSARCATTSARASCRRSPSRSGSAAPEDFGRARQAHRTRTSYLNGEVIRLDGALRRVSPA